MNMRNERKMAQQIYVISDLINKGQHQKALDYLRDLETKNVKSRTIKFAKVGFLINIGFGLKDSQVVKEGIISGERLLRSPAFENHEAHLYYNIANGHVSLYQLGYERNKIEQIIDNQNLENAKYYFRKAVERESRLDSEMRAQLWTNYGNCLDSLGRVMEALYAYDEVLKTDPNFPMALGNKAIAIRFFADISGAFGSAMYIKSYQMLKSALENKDLIELGGNAARKNFEDEIEQIKRLSKDKSVLSQKLEHPLYDITHMTAFEKSYVDFCSKHKLFLNFHIHEDECEASIVDPIFPSSITTLDDNETSYDLAKHINQIKEDYLVARLLLVQSQFKRDDFDRISKRTTFVNTLDHSIFNVYVGLLKSSFKEAYNILDKISRFINEYYELGVQGHIYFTTIWQHKVNNERKIRPKILNSKNISLYALYDVFLDFKSGYYKRIQDIRNASVHERLVIYESVLTNLDSKEDKYNIGYETMLLQTINLLHLVKSAVIYLINFVQLEENKKKRDN